MVQKYRLCDYQLGDFAGASLFWLNPAEQKIPLFDITVSSEFSGADYFAVFAHGLSAPPSMTVFASGGPMGAKGGPGYQNTIDTVDEKGFVQISALTINFRADGGGMTPDIYQWDGQTFVLKEKGILVDYNGKPIK
jgi:hypothetical protein